MYTTPGINLRGRIEVQAGTFARVAVNALKTLSYKEYLDDRHSAKIIYTDHHDICYGSDRWRCLFQALITWRQLDKELEVIVAVSEKSYGPTYESICAERAEALWNEILKNAERDYLASSKGA